MKQVYIIPFDCVEHLYTDEGGFEDRDKVKRIGVKCGQVLSMMDFERESNLGNVDLTSDVILID